MRKKTFIGFISATLIYSMLMPTLVFGQNITSEKNQSNADANEKTSEFRNRYVEDLSQKAEEGIILPVQGLEKETEKLAQAVKGKDRRGTIITDRYGSKRFAVVEKLDLR